MIKNESQTFRYTSYMFCLLDVVDLVIVRNICMSHENLSYLTPDNEANMCKWKSSFSIYTILVSHLSKISFYEEEEEKIFC